MAEPKKRKPGGGRKPSPNSRTVAVNLRFTPEEKERIVKAASSNVSEFCRNAILRAASPDE